MSLSERLNISLGLLESLDDLHSTGVAHCDLKFDNIIHVDDTKSEGRGRYKFIDYGNAKTKEPCMGGSLQFMSPEVNKVFNMRRFGLYILETDQNWRFQSDVLSMGSVILTVLHQLEMNVLE